MSAWCQPMDNGEHKPRMFVVRFDDADQGDAVFDDEAEAYEFWERANITWNCYLFGAMPLRPVAPSPAPVVPLPPVECADYDPGREYIPLPGGWEIQTKGRGSSFRIAGPDKDGKISQFPVSAQPYLFERLTKMARDIRVALGHSPVPVEKGQ